MSTPNSGLNTFISDCFISQVVVGARQLLIFYAITFFLQYDELFIP